MKYLILPLLLLLSGVGFSQEVEECDTRIADIMEYIQFENSLLNRSQSSSSSCQTIRVVVHVIYDGQNPNNSINGKISPEQVKSQIRITNQSFRNDSLMYHSENAPLNYTVELATTDPDGNPTTGIIYHDGYALWGNAWSQYGLKYAHPNAIPEGIVAAELAWEADINGVKYLNTYVVSKIDGSSGGGVQAYAYFPTLSVVFGNYIIYNAFGAHQLQSEYNANFNLKSYTNKGFTWTHELLHNFGLFHTFQGNSCEPEINPYMQGDRVADTPPQTQGNNCAGACGYVSYNVMDYLSQTCKNRITAGQVERATAAIEQNLTAYFICSEEENDPCPQKTSDFNGDGVVNILDISLFSYRFGSQMGDAKFQPKFDLNCDGKINILDFSLIQF